MTKKKIKPFSIEQTGLLHRTAKYHVPSKEKGQSDTITKEHFVGLKKGYGRSLRSIWNSLI